ncbi:c-type cytochrome [Pseudopedobacter beijingensis]|uniref:C-type cytochrome n=1 Tax=Pseudopedobacter beijingensis TaxID=1207056 RepID=A0ABW4ICM2_9SPHI
MKKNIWALSLVAVFAVACGGNQNNQTQADSTTQDVTTKQTAEEPLGKQLMSKTDCSACHTEKSKIVGPSYVQVAEKYENTEANITMLADKVIKGGVGVWGEVPMTPHPQLSEADAKEMIKYIFTLKK